ncbi:MAG: preprotein translocase subunit SecG [Planctomycetota bacterium]|jgi:preprotein translocase subunit SecG
MAVFSILAVTFVMKVIGVLFVICAVALVLVVLIQKGRGGGLSGAFGGAMASGILGSKTGDFLTWVTIVLVSVFLLLAVLMAKFYRPSISDFGGGPARRPPAGQRQPRPAEPPLPGLDTRGESGDANVGADVNVPVAE